MNSVRNNWVKMTECYLEVEVFSPQLTPLRTLHAIIHILLSTFKKMGKPEQENSKG